MLQQQPAIGRRITTHLSLNFLAGAALVFLFAGALAPVAHGQSAGTWNKRGQAAEARDDFDAAFEAFRQAHLKKPTDLRYKTRYERLRFEAANQHLDRGRVLRQSGDYAGASTEFQRALQIDPGNQAASQELSITEHPPVGASGGTANVALPVRTRPPFSAPRERPSFREQASRRRTRRR